MAEREQDSTATQQQSLGGASFERAVYIISVAAELAGVHPQTLRIYERKGLVRPARTAGNTRRYSDRDIERLQLIQELTQERGVNLAGVEMILDLRAQVAALRNRMEVMRKELERNQRRLREEREGARRSNAAGQIVPVSSIQRLLRSVLDESGRFSESR